MKNPTVDFKIIALDKGRGQITVKFYNSTMEVTHAIDLPVQGGALLDLRDQALTDYIMGFCPYAEFARRQAFLAGADYSHIENRLDVAPVVVAPIAGAQQVLPVTDV